MMNRTKRTVCLGYALILLLAILLVGCSNDTDERLGQEEQTMPVSFSLSFSKMSTRSTLDNIWPDNTHITISDGTGHTYEYQTADNSSSLASGVACSLKPVSNVIYWDNPTVVFSAWYPAGGNAVPTSMTLAADQSVLDNTTNPTGISDETYYAYDRLYCPPACASFTFRQSEPIALRFHHQLARVIVIANTNLTEGIEGVKEVVNKVEFGGGRLGLKGQITTLSTNGENGTTLWTLSTEEAYINKSITMRNISKSSETANNIYTYECMALPQKNETSSTGLITITTSGSADGVRTYTYKSAFELKAGYQYTYNLRVSEQGTITLVTVQVTDWDGTPVNVDNTAVIPVNSYPSI